MSMVEASGSPRGEPMMGRRLAMGIVVIQVNEHSDETKNAALTQSDWMERGRKWWRARPSRVIDAERLVVVDIDEKIVAAGRIRGVEKDLDGSGRLAILVNLEQDSELVGKTLRTNDSRNPVNYVDVHDFEERLSR